MKKRSVKHDEAYENFLNELDEMTDEEFEEKLQRVKDFARFHQSDKDRERIAKRFIKGHKYIENNDKKSSGKDKKAAKRANAVTKKIMKEAKEASKL
jgi:hypothetical protein